MDFAEAACGLQVQFVLHAECSSDAICCSRTMDMSLPALLPSTAVNLLVVLLLDVVLHGLCCCGVCGKPRQTSGKKKTLADYAIVRRIHFIFERAVRKFKTDLSLWTAWLEYCRSSNSNR